MQQIDVLAAFQPTNDAKQIQNQSWEELAKKKKYEALKASLESTLWHLDFEWRIDKIVHIQFKKDFSFALYM